MSTPFLGEIKIMAFNFAPKGWALCDGQIMSINQNAALFSLLGTFYGGNGVQTFALPNLQGRAAVHMGNNFTIGQQGGEQSHTLNIEEIPNHAHTLVATSAEGNTAVPGSANAANMLAGLSDAYTPSADLTGLSPSALANAGGNQPHQNMQPYLTVNFCIALSGIFPSRN